MLVIARLLGIVILLMGISILFNPVIMKNLITFWEKGKRIYAAGVLRLIFGVIFLLIASQSRKPIIVTIIGLLFLIGGIIIFGLGEKKVKAILKKYQETPALTCRILSLIAVVIGAVIVMSV
ncbi:MAG: hypothetical protein JW800_03645 [Candidatus Omnitrophica bacterium]|nr:hypothetical protein [Candidatus Omnitrophota bacterium]